MAKRAARRPQRTAKGSVAAMPRWHPVDALAVLVMAVLGIAIAIYLTTVHYARVPLVCTSGGVVNCAQVTSSAYSVVPGTALPITVPGMLYFLVSGALAARIWQCTQRGARTVRLRLWLVALGAVGLVTVLYLVYAEIVLLRAICEWCTVIHLLTLATFLVALHGLQRAAASEG